jgi:hypothetical protein
MSSIDALLNDNSLPNFEKENNKLIGIIEEPEPEPIYKEPIKKEIKQKKKEKFTPIEEEKPKKESVKKSPKKEKKPLSFFGKMKIFALVLSIIILMNNGFTKSLFSQIPAFQTYPFLTGLTTNTIAISLIFIVLIFCI